VSAERFVSQIPHAQADYALRLMEKGYNIPWLAREIGVDTETMAQAIEEAIERRSKP
jgi:hypothetical protein